MRIISVSMRTSAYERKFLDAYESQNSFESVEHKLSKRRNQFKERFAATKIVMKTLDIGNSKIQIILAVKVFGFRYFTIFVAFTQEVFDVKKDFLGRWVTSAPMCDVTVCVMSPMSTSMRDVTVKQPCNFLLCNELLISHLATFQLARCNQNSLTASLLNMIEYICDNQKKKKKKNISIIVATLSIYHPKSIQLSVYLFSSVKYLSLQFIKGISNS